MSVSAAATASPRQLYQGQPGTSIGTLYTSPAVSANVTAPSATAYINEIIIANVTAAAATIRIHLVPNAGAASVTNALYYDISIPANDTKILSGLSTKMGAVSTIQALQGTASAITLTISGAEVQ